MERFVLHWTAAGGDPYLVARVFSVVNAGLSQLAPICTERFHCRDSSVWTDIDFVCDRMFFEFGLTMTIRIGQIVGTGIRLAVGALMILLRSKRRIKQEKKEEEQALNKWLAEHPEDAARYQAELEAQQKAELEARQEIKEKEAEGEKVPEGPNDSEHSEENETQNEKDLTEAIENLTKEKTIIMIAHRLKTVRNADQIIVIDKGRIVQKGKHDDLMKEEGIYKNFVSGRKQAVSWKIA